MSVKNIIFVIMFLFSSLIFYVWQRTEDIRLGYEVSDMQGKCEKISQDNSKLQLQVSSYLSMEKLDNVAKKKGLFVPDEKNIIYLEN